MRLPLRLITLLSFALISIASCLADDDIDIPVSSDGEDNPYPIRHRSAPMQHWCKIDIDGATISSSVNGIISYELISDSGEASIISTTSPLLLIDRLRTLPDGQYTIRLITADTSYSGSFYLSSHS